MPKVLISEETHIKTTLAFRSVDCKVIDASLKGDQCKSCKHKYTLGEQWKKHLFSLWSWKVSGFYKSFGLLYWKPSPSRNWIASIWGYTDIFSPRYICRDRNISSLSVGENLPGQSRYAASNNPSTWWRHLLANQTFHHHNIHVV